MRRSPGWYCGPYPFRGRRPGGAHRRATGGGDTRAEGGHLPPVGKVGHPRRGEPDRSGRGEVQPATKILCTAAGSQVAFGAKGTDSRGGVSGNFAIDGNNVATNPLYLGRTTQRMFQPIDVYAAAGYGAIHDEGQNNVILRLTNEDCAGLKLDNGTDGHPFVGFESNNNGSAGGYNLLITQTDAPVAGLYTAPTHIRFDHSPFERVPVGSPGSARVEAGDAITFDTPIFTSQAVPGEAKILLDVVSGTVNVRSGRYFGDDVAVYVKGLRVANAATRNEMAVPYFNGVVAAYSIVNGAVVNQEFAPLRHHRRNRGRGRRHPGNRDPEQGRPPSADHPGHRQRHVRDGPPGWEARMRFRKLGTGKMEWMDGSSFAGDTNLYRAAAGCSPPTPCSAPSPAQQPLGPRPPPPGRVRTTTTPRSAWISCRTGPTGAPRAGCHRREPTQPQPVEHRN